MICRPAVAYTRTALPTELVHATLLLLQIFLLRANNTSRSADMQPSNCLARSKIVVLHDEEANEGASAPKSSKTVHGKDSSVSFSKAQKRIYTQIARCRAVGESEVHVVKPRIYKGGRLVLGRD